MNRTLDLECTMCQDGNRLELHYGVQEYTGVKTGTCHLSEDKIQEIRHAKYEDVQRILESIAVEWKS